jgi:hypothetical protein
MRQFINKLMRALIGDKETMGRPRIFMTFAAGSDFGVSRSDDPGGSKLKEEEHSTLKLNSHSCRRHKRYHCGGALGLHATGIRKLMLHGAMRGTLIDNAINLEQR